MCRESVYIYLLIWLLVAILRSFSRNFSDGTKCCLSQPAMAMQSLLVVRGTLYTHSLLIHEEDTMVVSTSWRSSQFSCKPNTRLNWLNWWDLLLDIWEYTGTPPTGNWFFQRRRDPSKMSLTWYSWEKNALLQEVETAMVSSSWTSRECVYGLSEVSCSRLLFQF